MKNKKINKISEINILNSKFLPGYFTGYHSDVISSIICCWSKIMFTWREMTILFCYKLFGMLKNENKQGVILWRRHLLIKHTYRSAYLSFPEFRPHHRSGDILQPLCVATTITVVNNDNIVLLICNLGKIRKKKQKIKGLLFCYT